MTLATSSPIGFIPTRDAAAARSFFENTLGLRFISDDNFALVFRVGPGAGSMLRVARTGDFTPAPYTIFGWEVTDIQQTAQKLATGGITFLRFDFLEQDTLGIWSAPDGARVAWFHDPDGNTLSISQHP